MPISNFRYLYIEGFYFLIIVAIYQTCRLACAVFSCDLPYDSLLLQFLDKKHAYKDMYFCK